MKIPKPERRLVDPLMREARIARILWKRTRGSHLRWSALARYPGNPVQAVLLYFWERNGHPDIL